MLQRIDIPACLNKDWLLSMRYFTVNQAGLNAHHLIFSAKRTQETGGSNVGRQRTKFEWNYGGAKDEWRLVYLPTIHRR